MSNHIKVINLEFECETEREIYIFNYCRVLYIDPHSFGVIGQQKKNFWFWSIDFFFENYNLNFPNLMNDVYMQKWMQMQRWQPGGVSAGCQVLAADLLYSRYGKSGVVEGPHKPRNHFLTKFLLIKISIYYYRVR